MTDLNYKHAAVGGLGLVGYLLLADDVPAVLEEAQNEVQNVADRVQEVSANGELVVDPLTGVFYDDPETGPLNDEGGDDLNVSFEAANELLAEAGEHIDPTTYAPDTQDGSTAPSSGVLADAGDSQEWGDAEAEDDDLTERTATSNLSDDQKSMWDRMANYDDSSQADNEYSAPDDAVTYDHSIPEEEEAAYSGGYDSDSTTSTSSTDDTDTTTSSYDDVGSWGSDDEEDDEEDDTNYYDNYYDQGGSTGSSFV